MNNQQQIKCRICHKVNGCMSLYDKFQEKFLPALIEYCCGVKISPHEEPNALVCLECSYGLIQAEHVIKKFRTTQKLLQEQSVAPPDGSGFLKDIKINTVDGCNKIKEFKEHSSRTHNKFCYNFSCDLCEFESVYAMYFRRHLMEAHGIKKPRIFKCSLCPEAYVEHRSLRDHIAYVHENLPRQSKFICSTCDKGFAKQSHLARHFYVHNPEKRPFHCDGCSMKFVNLSSAKRHILSAHAEIKPHVCDVCNNRYGTIYGLKAHMKHIHNLCYKGYKCPNCATVFSTQRLLDCHMTHDCKKRM